MTATAQALIDRYRCPEAFVNLPLRGRLSETAGFFRFGPGITCYGRSSAGTRAAHSPCCMTHRTMWEWRTRNSSSRSIQRKLSTISAGRATSALIPEFARSRSVRTTPCARFCQTRREGAIQRAQLRDWGRLIFPNWPVDTTLEDLCEKPMSLSMRALGVDRVPFVWFWTRWRT